MNFYEDSKVLYEYDSGCIYELYTTGGQRYESYIPYDVDLTKSVIVYDPGDGHGGGVNSSNNWKLFRTDFETNGYDHIVIRSLRKDNSQYYNDLVDRLSLEPHSKLFVSHSGGTTYNFNEYCDLIEEGNELPGVIAVMDGYTSASWFKNQSVTQKIINSETILFGFHQNWRNDYAKNYEAFVKDGVPKLILSDTSKYGQSHGGVNILLTENVVMDYLTGNGELPDNNIKYYYSSYVNDDGTTGVFVTIDYEKS